MGVLAGPLLICHHVHVLKGGDNAARGVVRIAHTVLQRIARLVSVAASADLIEAGSEGIVARRWASHIHLRGGSRPRVAPQG